MPVEVIEQVLNHRSGTFRGIVGVYQRHDYIDERRIALQRWADFIEQLVSGGNSRHRRADAQAATPMIFRYTEDERAEISLGWRPSR